jgi:hypothetical protein
MRRPTRSGLRERSAAVQTVQSGNLPKGIQEGRYTMRSALYMDGQKVRTNEVPMLVVS